MKYQPDQAWKEERKENIYSPLKKEKKRNKLIDTQFELNSTHSKWHCTQSEIRLAVIRSRMNHRPTLQPFHALLIATVKRNAEERNKKRKKKKKNERKNRAVSDE